MVDPIKPTLRSALLELHSGLDEDTIDRFEELSVSRFQFDPDTEADAIQKIEAEMEALKSARMPNFEEAQLRVEQAE